HAAVGDELAGSSEGVVGEGGDGVHVHGGGLSVWRCVCAVNTQCTSKLVNLSSFGVFQCSRRCEPRHEKLPVQGTSGFDAGVCVDVSGYSISSEIPGKFLLM